MKWRKWIKVLRIALVLLIVGSAIGLFVLSMIHSRYEGKIEGTEFIIQEFFGAGKNEYDVDDYGNLYFAGFNWGGGFVLVYDSKGEYLYTIKVSTSGSVGVNIDDDNNILVFVTRADKIIHYTNDGVLEYIEKDVQYSRQRDFLPYTADRTRVRNGINYINKNRTIIKEENGIETVVFKVPVWQRWHRALKTLALLLWGPFVISIGLPHWVKGFKNTK